MSNDRVKELQDISNEFLRRLGEDEDAFDPTKSPLKTEINSEIKSNSKKNKLNLPNFSISRLYKRESEKKNSLVNINY
jgi:histone H3/H4